MTNHNNQGIVLNRMYVGDYLASNLGHEVINLYQADNPQNYIYLHSTGDFVKAHQGQVSHMLFVKYYGIGEVEVVLADDIVGSRGLAMGTEEDGDVGECGQIGGFDDLEAFVSESVNFSLVVYDVSNAIEVFAGGQLFLEGGNGTSDSEAEA